MKLISWNIAGRLSCVNKQIRYLLDGNFDIICLQEVISKAEVPIVQQFKSSGYNSINSVPNSSLPNKGKHKYNLLIISKADIKHKPPLHPIKWKEKYLRGLLKFDSKDIEVTTMHVPPGSSNGIEKIVSIEQFYENIIDGKSKYRIICGDWNTPREESENGEITTWMRTGKNTGYGKRWDEGERLLLEGLKDFDIYDSFRQLHGYGLKDYSWYIKTKDGIKGRRYDHIHSSDTLVIEKCYYDHSVRESKLSDHSAIISEFNFD